jgi:precorrin-6Y C5,15-methyltransferase (decarboxylating)
VERDPAQLSLLEENVARAKRAVVIVPGEAPQALAGLPDPDGVFLGGSGGQLAALLACAADRLRPGGRLVANFATLEHLGEALAWLRGRGWTCETVLLGAARGSDVAGLTRLAALHPVFILSAWRAAEQEEPDS